MFEAIGEFWTKNTFGDKIYIGYLIFVLFLAACYLFEFCLSTPKRKLDFITKAQKNGCIAVGKMTCLTIHGSRGPEYYEAEYMYVVDDKRYFVTYKMAYNIPADDRKEEMNADMLLLKLKPVLILFYDKDKPKKVMSKLEVFTSSDGLDKTHTPKHNVWRDVEKEWTEPIHLYKVV